MRFAHLMQLAGCCNHVYLFFVGQTVFVFLYDCPYAHFTLYFVTLHVKLVTAMFSRFEPSVKTKQQPLTSAKTIPKGCTHANKVKSKPGTAVPVLVSHQRLLQCAALQYFLVGGLAGLRLRFSGLASLPSPRQPKSKLGPAERHAAWQSAIVQYFIETMLYQRRACST